MLRTRALERSSEVKRAKSTLWSQQDQEDSSSKTASALACATESSRAAWALPLPERSRKGHIYATRFRTALAGRIAFALLSILFCSRLGQSVMAIVSQANSSGIGRPRPLVVYGTLLQKWKRQRYPEQQLLTISLERPVKVCISPTLIASSNCAILLFRD